MLIFLFTIVTIYFKSAIWCYTNVTIYVGCVLSFEHVPLEETAWHGGIHLPLFSGI